MSKMQNEVILIQSHKSRENRNSHLMAYYKKLKEVSEKNARDQKHG